MRYGIRDFLFLLLLLQPPAIEPLPLLGDGVIVRLHSGAMLRYHAVHLLLNAAILFRLARRHVFDHFLLYTIEGVEGAIAAYGILDDVLRLPAGAVQSHDAAAALDLAGRAFER